MPGCPNGDSDFVTGWGIMKNNTIQVVEKVILKTVILKQILLKTFLSKMDI